MPIVALLRRRIAVKLTLTLISFVGLVVLLAGVYLDVALESYAEDTLEARLATAGGLVRDELRQLVRSDAAPAELQRFALRVAGPTQSRVTVIAPDGHVLADSGVALGDVPGLENHATRPEVRRALEGRPGRHLRSSATIQAPLFYVGLPVTEGGRVVAVLRLALPLAVVTASHRAITQALLAGGVLALAAAFGIGIFISRRITRPVVQMERIAQRMSEGDLRARAPVQSPDEIGQLGRALNAMAAALEGKLADLAREHAKITTLLDAMAEGVVAVDGHDAILLLNEPARRMFGVPTGTGEGRPLLEVVRSAELHAVVRVARGAVEHQALRREIMLDGRTRRRLEIRAMPLRLGAGPLGVVMLLDDVTELRRLESVRTEFIANVSHELRTPLTAIGGYVETLRAGAIDEPADARRFLEIVHRHTERLGRLLNDLTDLSNIELGRVTLAFAPTPLADVVDAVLEILRPRAAAGELTFAVNVPADLPPVHADYDRLHQILINLVDNAVKYTPPGGGVAITAIPFDEAVEITVADTGVGIPPADLPRITERFYRVDKARSRDLGGTGLGLAIVKHLVQAHGGSLVIESVPGQGTTVRLHLPTAAA